MAQGKSTPEGIAKTAIKELIDRLPGYHVWNNFVRNVALKGGGHINAGLCKGSSDLVGWRVVRITSEMVGKRMAQFVAIEVKKPQGGVVTPEQQEWLDMLNRDGGFGIVVTSVDSTIAQL
jgi:hypothetical protein